MKSPNSSATTPPDTEVDDPNRDGAELCLDEFFVDDEDEDEVGVELGTTVVVGGLTTQ